MEFKAEPLESLKARFPKALEKVWDVDLSEFDRPGLHREHVFDFEDGIRLIISKDSILEVGDPDIHVSASWQDVGYKSLEHTQTQVVRHWKLLGGKGKFKFIGLSPKGVPHWIVEEEPLI